MPASCKLKNNQKLIKYLCISLVNFMKVENKNIGKASSIEGLQLDDIITIATHHVRDDDNFRVWCDCGEELHWNDDESLSDCNNCTPP